jgi:hypothetical protein
VPANIAADCQFLLGSSSKNQKRCLSSIELRNLNGALLVIKLLLLCATQSAALPLLQNLQEHDHDLAPSELLPHARGAAQASLHHRAEEKP